MSGLHARLVSSGEAPSLIGAFFGGAVAWLLEALPGGCCKRDVGPAKSWSIRLISFLAAGVRILLYLAFAS